MTRVGDFTNRRTTLIRNSHEEAAVWLPDGEPSKKILRLSASNYQDSSLAAVGVAAHEAGHAIQDASHYPLLVVRNLIVPLAGIGSNISFTALLAGVIFQSMKLVWVGILLFSTVVVFQLEPVQDVPLSRGCDRASAKDFHEIRAVFTRGVA
ncbi:MAG: zinc metallopeptidase [Isosphaeraceae bacterium]